MRESQLLSLPVKLIDNYQEYNRFANERKFNNQYYMVRHGQSEANINNLLCNHLSSPSREKRIIIQTSHNHFSFSKNTFSNIPIHQEQSY